MKKHVIFILMLGITHALCSQKKSYLGKAFIMNTNYSAQECDAVGGHQTATTNYLLITYKIIVEGYTSTGYIVTVPVFNDGRDVSYNKTAAGVTIYFFIPLTDFDNVCTESISRRSFAVGIPTIPAKLRFGNGGTGVEPRYFRFDGNVSLGLSAGFKYSFGADMQYAINGLGGFTIASVNVDSLTTKGRVKVNTSAASFSPHVGLVFDFQQFQIGLYSGIDFLYGEPNKYWVYRNQPWLGIGLGYNIFKVGKPDDTNK